MIKGKYICLILMVLLACSACAANGVSDDTGSPKSPFKYVVAKDGSGDFATVQQAIDSVSSYNTSRTYIYIKNGTYKQVLNVPADKNNVTLIGQSKDKVILTYDNAANKIDPETGEPFGTSGSASTYIHGEGFVAKNITFQNSAGFKHNGGIDHGQTLAIYVDADKSIFDNCRFLSGQDTFYADRIRAYVSNSYIEGTTDFIWGPATVVFQDCEIHSYGGTAITAANTPQYINYGLVFHDCSLDAEAGVKTTLGRPYRAYSAVAFLNSSLGSSIKPVGWTNWHETDRYKTARYEEYENTGAGADPSQRVNWAHIITDSGEAKEYGTLNVLKTQFQENPVVDNWNPLKTLQKIDDEIKPASNN